ncbi:hypothetical protein E2I00_012775, partial [Balaenoptera physalus]
SESRQEHLSHQPPGAPFQEEPTDKQVETGSPSLVNPEVQKLLEILITKKVELKIHKGKEKDGSFSEQMSSDYHLNTLGNTTLFSTPDEYLWTRLSYISEQDTIFYPN